MQKQYNLVFTECLKQFWVKLCMYVLLVYLEDFNILESRQIH